MAGFNASGFGLGNASIKAAGTSMKPGPTQVGDIRQFSSIPPSTWVKADGSFVNSSTYPALGTILPIVPTIATLSSTNTAITAQIVYVGGYYWGTAGTSGPYCYKSLDAITWTSVSQINGSYSCSAFAYLNGSFYAAIGTNNASNSIYASSDGITWTAIANNDTGSILNFYYINGIYFALGTNYLQTSLDGKTWAGPLNINCATLAYSNGVYVATTTSGLYYSTNPTLSSSWTSVGTSQFSGTSSTAAVLTAGNGIFVYQTTGTGYSIYTSSNGTSWTKRTTIATGVTILSNCIFYRGYFLTIGADYKGYISQDGITWYIITTSPWSSTANTPKNLVYLNGSIIGIANSYTTAWTYLSNIQLPYAPNSYVCVSP